MTKAIVEFDARIKWLRTLLRDCKEVESIEEVQKPIQRLRDRNRIKGRLNKLVRELKGDGWTEREIKDTISDGTGFIVK